jgi:hypothetical protein
MAGIEDTLTAKEIKKRDRIDLVEKINKYFKPEVSFTKSGKQNIAGIPLEMDIETLNLMLELGIPLSEAWKLTGKHSYGKNRAQTFLDDQELSVGEGGEKIRQLGLGYNQGGEGLSGSGVYNIDTGDTDLRVDYKKQVDFNKMLNNFFRKK